MYKPAARRTIKPRFEAPGLFWPMMRERLLFSSCAFREVVLLVPMIYSATCWSSSLNNNKHACAQYTVNPGKGVERRQYEYETEPSTRTGTTNRYTSTTNIKSVLRRSATSPLLFGICAIGSSTSTSRYDSFLSAFSSRLCVMYGFLGPSGTSM